MEALKTFLTDVFFLRMLLDTVLCHSEKLGYNQESRGPAKRRVPGMRLEGTCSAEEVAPV